VRGATVPPAATARTTARDLHPPAAPSVGGGPTPRPRQAGGPVASPGRTAAGPRDAGKDRVRRPTPSRRPVAATGLTAPGALVLASGATLLGGLLDEMFTDTLGLLFATVFLVSSALVAAKTRIRDLTAAFFAPPVAFALTVLVLSVVFPSDNAESFLVRTFLDIFTALAFKAGLLWGGTTVAAVIVLVRRRADREATRRRTAREARASRGEVRDPRAGQPVDRDRAWSGRVAPGLHNPRESRDVREAPREH
ncbi:MAG TPA: DUF6542 domain-containing protein, partial [Yinghuangia sp.]|nr:DUF6542 domain-containing protein [Yinghuangia sp.]